MVPVLEGGGGGRIVLGLDGRWARAAIASAIIIVGIRSRALMFMAVDKLSLSQTSTREFYEALATFL